MGVCNSVCGASTHIGQSQASLEERERLAIVYKINAKKQKKVPLLEIDINPMFVQRKLREGKLSQSV